MNDFRGHAPNPKGLPRTKIEIPEIEKKVGNATILIEDTITALLQDEELQKHPVFSAVVNGCTRLSEGRFWLVAAANRLAENRVKGNGHTLPPLPKK